MRDKVLIIGASEHAKVIIDIIEKEGKYVIAGLIDSKIGPGETTSGHPVLGSEKQIPDIIKQIGACKFFVAIGDNWVRKLVVDSLMINIPEAEFVNAIHPSAIIGKNIQLGKGIAIMPGVIINSDCRIGNFTILNTKASLDHDCILHKYASVAPNVTVGGKSEIGAFSVISIGATLIHGITVGQHALIGAGAVLLENCEDNIIMYGVPAKIIKRREPGDKYL